MISINQIEAIETWRLAKGWSQARMAAELGTYPSHYSEYIRGLRALPINAVKRAYKLGIAADILLKGEDDE